MRGWRHDRAGQPLVGMRRMRGGVHRRDATGRLCPDCAAGRPAARAAAAVAGCPAAGECESCGAADAQLWVLEGDTPVGVICLTLCGPCADAGRTPRLSCPAAVRRAMAHEEHTGAGVAW